MTSRGKQTPSRTLAIRAHYEPRIAAGGPYHEVVNWASAAAQRARFEVLLANVPLRGRSVLDIGCGVGDLPALLDERGIVCEYTGVDILERMVEVCRQRLPGKRFLWSDVFSDSPFEPESFDVVFCSGAFNLDLGNNREFLGSAVRRMAELSRRHVVFNLLHAREQPKEPRYFFYEPGEVVELMRPLGGEISIIDDYLHNDFTVILLKDDRPRRRAK